CSASTETGSGATSSVGQSRPNFTWPAVATSPRLRTGGRSARLLRTDELRLRPIVTAMRRRVALELMLGVRQRRDQVTDCVREPETNHAVAHAALVQRFQERLERPRDRRECPPRRRLRPRLEIAC